jgi:hypothetical protein
MQEDEGRKEGRKMKEGKEGTYDSSHAPHNRTFN